MYFRHFESVKQCSWWQTDFTWCCMLGPWKKNSKCTKTGQRQNFSFISYIWVCVALARAHCWHDAYLLKTLLRPFGVAGQCIHSFLTIYQIDDLATAKVFALSLSLTGLFSFFVAKRQPPSTVLTFLRGMIFKITVAIYKLNYWNQLQIEVS